MTTAINHVHILPSYHKSAYNDKNTHKSSTVALVLLYFFQCLGIKNKKRFFKSYEIKKPKQTSIYKKETNSKKEQYKQEGLKAMNSQDIARIGYKAKRETEAFINNYLNDRAKGWPLLCRCGSPYCGYHQEEYIRRPDMLQILLAN